MSLMQKTEEAQNSANAAKDSIIAAPDTVLTEAANREKQGGSGKKGKN